MTPNVLKAKRTVVSSWFPGCIEASCLHLTESIAMPKKRLIELKQWRPLERNPIILSENVNKLPKTELLVFLHAHQPYEFSFS